MEELKVTESEFIELYKEISVQTGKYLTSDITGYRALDIIHGVFEELRIRNK